MKNIIRASVLAAFAVTMLLPGIRQVNAASVNHKVLRQGGNPIPTGNGGNFQGGNPIPTGNGGNFQGGNPIPTGNGGN